MTRRITTLDLTLAEQEHVRNALQLFRARVGGWATTAKILHFDEITVLKAGNGTRTVTASMTFRLARVLGVTVDDLLRGRVTDLGTCPRCGYADPREAKPAKKRVRKPQRRMDVSAIWIRPS